MNPNSQSPAREAAINRILESLPKKALAAVNTLEYVSLQRGMVLYEAGQHIDHVYFLDDALVSIISINSEGATVEIGLVGHEGMVGVPAILGGVTPYRAVVHVAGRARRMKRKQINEEFRNNRQLQDLLLRYMNGFIVQVTQSSICNCYHSVQERLCRWLLVASDATRSDILDITHDLIAGLLATRRASVTVAAGLLHKAGLVRIHRGRIQILNRAGLETMVCECYGILRDNLWNPKSRT